MERNIRRLCSVFLIIVFFNGCSKDPAQPGYLSSELIPVTQSVTAIGQTIATGGVQVSGSFSSDVIEKGICWGTNYDPTIFQAKVSGGAGTGFASLSLSGLAPATTYYVRAYAKTVNETIYGEQVQFRTLSYQLASLSTTSVTNISLTAASSGGSVSAQGGGNVTAKGICWATYQGPTIVNAHTTDGRGLGSFTSTLNGLSPGTMYYVRAYATNEAGTAYGYQYSFVSASIHPATLTSVTVSSISRTSVIVSASASADGGGTITNRGICWSTAAYPTIPYSNYTLNGSGTGTMSASLNNLVSGVTYYIRAYATNAAGTAYGPMTSFRTL